MKRKLLHPDFYQNICNPNQDSEGHQLQPDIWIAQLGRFYGYGTFKMNYFTEHLFCYIVYSGKTKLTVDGQNWTMRKGDLCFFFPNQHKTLQENPDDQLVNLYLDIKGERASEIFKQMEIKPGQQLFRGKFDELCEPLFKDLENTFAKATHPVHYPTIAAWRFIDLISQTFQTSKKTATSPAEIARQYIQQNFRHHLSIQELSRKLNISRATLFRQFKIRYNLSPKQYLNEIRLRQAKQLLKKTHTSISEIAFSCGYDSPQHFSRMFKRAFKVTPKEFKHKSS